MTLSDYFQHLTFVSEEVTHWTWTLGELVRLRYIAENRPSLFSMCGKTLKNDRLTDGPVTCIECIVAKEAND